MSNECICIKELSKVKPILYAHYYELLKDKAREYGFNLLLSGSLNRDLDLVAVQWVDCSGNLFKMIQEFDLILTGKFFTRPADYGFKILQAKRLSFIININRGGHWNDYQDGQFYLDISVICNDYAIEVEN